MTAPRRHVALTFSVGLVLAACEQLNENAAAEDARRTCLERGTIGGELDDCTRREYESERDQWKHDCGWLCRELP
jgi:hypothetical protein